LRYTLLGRTGLRVSELCLGGMTLGERWGWGTSRETARAVVERFAEAGGNFIDTANNYTGGESETYLGELLDGDRDQFVLATKYTVQSRPGDLNSAGNHRKNLVASLEASLRRLRTDRIDLYWVHARDTLTPVEEVMRALDDQVRAGKVLYAGVSDWPAWEVARATTLAELRGWSPFVALQAQYNLLERTPERELLPMAHGLDLAVLAWSPLAAGQLTGKYLRDGDGSPAAGSRRLDQLGGADADQRTRAVVGEVVAVAEEGGWTPAQVALAWLRSRPGIVVPILGVTRLAQLEDNLASLEVELGAEQLERLAAVSAIDAGFPYGFLRSDRVKQIVYGDRWRQVDDRRATVGRTVADDLFG
jgi:aryl-alcohol dehydrogenase-like predicted oxidoreductase